MRDIELIDIGIKGYKSIRELNNFKPGAINIFIGQNGAGKSNFISFFKFLANMLSGTGNLGVHTAINGGASKILFDSILNAPLESDLVIRSKTGVSEYKFKLLQASGDSFILKDEQYRFMPNNQDTTVDWTLLGTGQKESLLAANNGADKNQISIKKTIQNIVIYQFHNTTFNAPIRNFNADVENGWFLEEDGRNLAAVLYDLSNNEPAIYFKIINILAQIIPFFLDFALFEEYGKVNLKWKERATSQIFVGTQASDGMLRAMALVTLLCLPPKRLPGIMFIDEPELGLHPSAIKIICSLIHGVSEYCQVFIATQNADMLNEFDINDIVVVSREGRESVFNRLDNEDFKEWLDDYSLAQLWNQNIIGGRP